MPMRWPWQQVMKVLSARTPRSIGAPTRRRACAAGGGAAERIGRRARRQRALAVDRLAHGVDHPAEPAGRRPHRARHRRHHGAAAAPHALQRRERHQQRIAAGKADHLAGDRLGRASRSPPGRRPTWRGSARPPRPSGRARRPPGRKPRRRRVPRSARPAPSSPTAPPVTSCGRVLTALFTRVVNHYVTVVGIKAVAHPARTEG